MTLDVLIHAREPFPVQTKCLILAQVGDKVYLHRTLPWYAILEVMSILHRERNQTKDDIGLDLDRMTSSREKIRNDVFLNEGESAAVRRTTQEQYALKWFCYPHSTNLSQHVWTALAE